MNYSCLDNCQGKSEIEDTINEYFFNCIRNIVETNPDPEKECEEIKFKVNFSNTEFQNISLNKLDHPICKLKNK